MPAACICIIHQQPLFYYSADHRDLHSFPTRRSSDLLREAGYRIVPVNPGHSTILGEQSYPTLTAAEDRGMPRVHRNDRSEEHTSELQSQSNLVCRLLLEKKKK